MGHRSLLRCLLSALVLAACGARTELQDPLPLPPGPARQPVCGNHVVEEGEGCDDGNTDATDACVQCRLATCGDGVIRAGFELCDGGEGCSACSLASCGDGAVSGAEECDDGNQTSTDACSTRCLAARCGDGVVQPGEECDLGAANESRPSLMITQGSLQRRVRPIESALPISGFYAYSSASAHTGLEAVGQSEVFFYRDLATGGLFLVLVHGADDASPPQPKSLVQMQILHLPEGFQLAVIDDIGSELFGTSSTSASGDWKFDNNTDGGAIGGLPFPGRWDIDVSPSFQSGIQSWVFVDGDRSTIPLDLTRTLTLSAFDEGAGCRLDCRLPRCGDDVLDAGEECDDGNTINNDGCNVSCRRAP